MAEVVTVVGLLLCCKWLFKQPEEHEDLDQLRDYSYHEQRTRRHQGFERGGGGHIRYTNPHNNHDDQKFLHETREDAELEVMRMKVNDYPGSDRLNVYYSPQRGGWLVGRSRY